MIDEGLTIIRRLNIGVDIGETYTEPFYWLQRGTAWIGHSNQKLGEVEQHIATTVSIGNEVCLKKYTGLTEHKQIFSIA